MKEIRPRRFVRIIEKFRHRDTTSTWETISKFDWLRDFEAFDETGQKVATSNNPQRLKKFMEMQKKPTQ